MLRCELACVLPSSSLDPRLPSGAFAVAKDEGRDRFVGDRRPLNRRERNIGRALASLPTALTHDLGEIRDGADYNSRHRRLFHLYEVPPSRVVKRVIGPRIPRRWLE